jgi:indole-3-glycerol phosphate synthase
MNILDAIVEHKRIEVLKRKRKHSLASLGAFPFYGRATNPLKIPEGVPGIIAEFKRKSPSRGAIHLDADPVDVAEGSFRDLFQVRSSQPALPLLRKDFIIDPYQVHETSAYGADIVLLIAAILEKQQVADLAQEARSLGLHVLLEVHDSEELEKYHDSIEFVGVNNRDLRTFRVDTERSLKLIGQMPPGVLAVSESGLGRREEIMKLARAGFRLFLMGESFMKQPDPGLACKSFMEQF